MRLRVFIAQFLHRKPIGECTTALLMPLRAKLGPLSLIALGIGAIIGAGIFVVTGVAASQFAGPAIMISFVLAGLACLFAGLCYAELASMIPISGSAYSYAYYTMGRGVAWIVGWNLILEYLFSAAAVSVGWSGYLVSTLGVLGLALPDYFTSAPLTFDDDLRLVATGAIVNLPAVALVLVITGLLLLGLWSTAFFNSVMVAVKVAVIVLFVVFGIQHVDPANWSPFLPNNSGTFGEYGWSGVMRGAAVIFFAYIGFDAVSTASQEAKNPTKSIPVGIIGSLVIVTILYVSMAAVLTGMVSYPELDVPNPVHIAVESGGPDLAWLIPLVNVGALVGLASVVFALVYAQPRIFYAMSLDRFLPRFFSRVHPKTHVPHLGIAATGAFAGVLAGLLPIGILSEMVSIGTLLAFLIVCAGVMVLRRTDPDFPRPFRMPAYPLVPIMGMLICAYLMLSLPIATWIRLFVWLAVGLLIFLSFGSRQVND